MRLMEFAAGTGKYDKHEKEGVYECGGCGTPLYKSTTKVRTSDSPRYGIELTRCD
jgi:peptide methionine sulfoxide reductase MsrB